MNFFIRGDTSKSGNNKDQNLLLNSPGPRGSVGGSPFTKGSIQGQGTYPRGASSRGNPWMFLSLSLRSIKHNLKKFFTEKTPRPTLDPEPQKRACAGSDHLPTSF